ncbi:hypothetical protein PS15p_212028 [Mucor circinelloides]
MTQITRKAVTIGSKRYKIGHYELSGYLQMRHNYENAHMLYSGMFGLPFQRKEELLNVDIKRVQKAYQALVKTHKLLLQYLDPTRAAEVVDFHVKENEQYVRKEETWKDNILMPSDGITPMTTSIDFNNLVIGLIDGKDVQLRYPGLIAFFFLHLFPLAT